MTGSHGVYIPPPRTSCVLPCPVWETQCPSLVREPSLYHLTVPMGPRGFSWKFPSSPPAGHVSSRTAGTQHPHTWDFLREAETWAQHSRVGIGKRSPDIGPIQLTTHPSETETPAPGHQNPPWQPRPLLCPALSGLASSRGHAVLPLDLCTCWPLGLELPCLPSSSWPLLSVRPGCCVLGVLSSQELLSPISVIILSSSSDMSWCVRTKAKVASHWVPQEWMKLAKGTSALFKWHYSQRRSAAWNRGPSLARPPGAVRAPQTSALCGCW